MSLGKPQLHDFDTYQPRLGRNSDLQQIGGDLVQRRNFDFDILCGAVLHQPEQARDEGQGRTLKAGEDDHEDEHDIEQELRACDALGQGDRGQHDGYGAAQTRPGQEGLMPSRES